MLIIVRRDVIEGIECRLFTSMDLLVGVITSNAVSFNYVVAKANKELYIGYAKFIKPGHCKAVTMKGDDKAWVDKPISEVTTGYVSRDVNIGDANNDEQNDVIGAIGPTLYLYENVEGSVVVTDIFDYGLVRIDSAKIFDMSSTF